MTSFEVLFVSACTLGIMGASFAVGYFVEWLNWRRRYEILALVAAIWVAVGVAHLLPLGHWTLLGYGFAVFVASCSVYAGWRISRSRRNAQTYGGEPLFDPNNWGF